MALPTIQADLHAHLSDLQWVVDAYTASIWWDLGMLGIGFGFMLSPLTAAVLSATPSTRAGLGSSMINTSRQVGSTLGVAVLGAVVVQQLAGNIVSHLTQMGIPLPTSETIAGNIASGGAQASQVSLPSRLPFSPAVLHQAIGRGFVDALHGSFVISGTALFIAALLVAFLLQPTHRSLSTSVELADSQVTTGASTIAQAASVIEVENCVLLERGEQA